MSATATLTSKEPALRSAKTPFRSFGWVWQALVMATLVDDLVPDQLWAMVEPLLPVPPRRRTAAGTGPSRTATASPRSSTWPAPRPLGGCRPPASWGCGSPATAWRRLDEWTQAGVFERLHLEVLDRHAEHRWSRPKLRGARVRARVWAHV
jgi:transposase